MWHEALFFDNPMSLWNETSPSHSKWIQTTQVNESRSQFSVWCDGRRLWNARVPHASQATAKSKSCYHQNWQLCINFGTLKMQKIWTFKKLIEPIRRYDNPDMHFLGTLKIEYQILKIFSFLMWDLVSFFNFRGAIHILLLQKASLWQPWRWKHQNNFKNIIKLYILCDLV